MADDRELVIRFLNMVRGSLDEKNTRLLEELRLKRLIVLGKGARHLHGLHMGGEECSSTLERY